MADRDLRRRIARGDDPPAIRSALPTAAFALGTAAVLLLLLLLMGGADSGGAHGSPERAALEPGAVLSLSTRSSHNGTYRVAVVDRTGSMRPGAEQSWIVWVARVDGAAVSDATIQADAWMPDTGEGVAARPQASGHLGGGTYRVEGLSFQKPGWWNVPLRIIAGAGTDSVAFNLILPAPAAHSTRTAVRGGAS